MLKHRIISGAVLLSTLLATAIWGPPWVHMLFVVALTVLGLSEFFAMAEKSGATPHRWVGTLLGAALPAACWASGFDACPTWALWVVLALIAIVPGLAAMRVAPSPAALLGWSTTLAGVVYIGLSFAFMCLVLHPGQAQDGRWLVLLQIVLVKFTDIGAYFIGSAFGRHKFAPRLSPAKSWEGVIGGMTVAVATSLLIWFLTKGQLGIVTLTWPHAVGLALVLSAGGIAGDLFESWIKRCASVKDSSAKIAGMGGILDVIDSLLLTSPLLYLYFVICLQ